MKTSIRASRMTITIDLQGVVASTSGDVLELTGHTQAQLIGHNVRALITPELRSAHHPGFSPPYQILGLRKRPRRESGRR